LKKNKKSLRGFSLAEVVWGVFLLATSIVVIVGVFISALKAIKKSEGIMDATNIMIEEKGKIERLGYDGFDPVPSPDPSYMVDTYWVVYHVEDYDYTGLVSNELKVVTVGVYNVPEIDIPSCPRDRLIAVKSTAALFYSPP